MNVFTAIKVAVIIPNMASGELGGAERFYTGLLNGLNNIGCKAELVSIPADESTFEKIIDAYKYCSELDLSGYDIVISTKTPTYAINHPCHVMYLVHTVRVFDDMFNDVFSTPSSDHLIQRAKLHKIDFDAISKIKARFSIGYEVSNRLFRWRGIQSDVLHPPLCVDGFECANVGDYFFLPGRLHPWKRVDLVIEAVKKSKLPIKLKISGTGEAQADLKKLADGDPRIEFLGRVDDKMLIELYANALAVIFVPLREDYGYVTLEAFASEKAVVTCVDSGEPTHFVKNRETGIVCQPNPDNLCNELEWLFNNPLEAQKMGRNGHALAVTMSWDAVATELVEAGIKESDESHTLPLKVTVLDMQPIMPAVGGGRQRLLGLYHNLGDDIDCQYIGSYDWPGEKLRRQQLSKCLEEIIVPLSAEHHEVAEQEKLQADGVTTIDIGFSQLGDLSPEYMEQAKEAIVKAEVVIFSHPWIYPLVTHLLNQNQLVVYDSQNVEGYLRAQLLDETNDKQKKLLRQVVEDEFELGKRADLILACSREDVDRFNRIYEFSYEKMRIAPNGVMAFCNELPTEQSKLAAKKMFHIDKDKLVAIFIGSPYGPNVEGAKFIVELLAPALPEVVFIIAGGVGEGIKVKRDNLIITGNIDEQEKYHYFSAADIALNPMFSGSGTNIKMFDFMAMKLPTVSTLTGARGIDFGATEALIISEPTMDSFVTKIGLLSDAKLRKSVGEAARTCVEDGYSWERISSVTGLLMASRKRLHGQPKPLFSVVIPSYERPSLLRELLGCLERQIERDFEVIIIDQSVERWADADKVFSVPIQYYHSPVKGAVRARNTGALLAQGKIIAFTDDDCLPSVDWLVNARKYFEDKSVVGVEGLIKSDHLCDPKWRPVTNVGFENIGFMTANLMVRTAIFHELGGFDLQFDKPHFREDTDFGWRMLEKGNVPYGSDVSVFHPAQSREIERESSIARGRFFIKDAYLYNKHPKQYKELFHRECNYISSAGFWENVLLGFEELNITMPAWLKVYHEERKR